MATVKTVLVHNPENSKYSLRINADDFDSSRHRRWGEQEAKSPSPPPIAPSPPPVKTRQMRNDELMAMEWTEIKAIAESFDPPIVKPDSGWKDAISEIVAREFG